MQEAQDKPQDVSAPSEKPEFGPSEPWLAEIEAAAKREKNWRKDARTTLKRYMLEGEENQREGRFNILWSNTEVLRQAIYNIPPKPDVRQRWETKDPVALAVAELMDRGLTYVIDTAGFDVVGRRTVLDYLLPGRSVVRVRYVPKLEPVSDADGLPMVDAEGKPVERIANEAIQFENVPWDDFLHSDATCWENVDWVAFRHRVTKEDAQKLFPAFAEDLKYEQPRDDGQDDDGRLASYDSQSTTERDKRAKVWEVWDSRTKTVIWVSKGIDKIMLKTPPPLELKGFWPVARPMLAVEHPGSLMPKPIYMQYQEQAKELDRITYRINKMVSVIKFRGLYDATLGADLARLFSEAKDGDMVPTDKALAYVEKGGLAGAIFTMPLNEAQMVLARLYESREATKQTIYEITGISDVLRGSTNPNETATAQQLKASWGASRVDGMKREVQRFFRDTLEIAAEIMAEHFQVETWAAMTSSKYPTAADKATAQAAIQQAQAAAYQAQMTGQQPGQDVAQKIQQAQAVLNQPSWDDIQKVMKDDLLRSYRVDIETDSTIAPNQQAEAKALGESMQMIGGLMAQLIPGVEKGIVPQKMAVMMLGAAIRKTPLANELGQMFDEFEGQLASGNPLEKKMKVLERENNDLKGQLKQKGQEMQIKAQEVAGDQQIAEGDLALRAEELRQRRLESAFAPGQYVDNAMGRFQHA